MSITPQKALHLYTEADKKKPKFIGHDYMISEKHDGWYGYLDFPSCIIHSRAMRQIPSLRELSDLIRSRRPTTSGRLLFEIMIDGLEVDSFYELNGILNRKNEQVDGVYIRVHDYLHNFRFDMPAAIRYNFAQEICARIDLPEVRMSPILEVSNDPLVWQGHAEKVWQRQGEGVILKRSDSLYSPEKRNFDLMKIKEELTLDLRVVGMEEGKIGSQFEGTLGALIVVDRAGNKHRISGMTPKQRDDWWKEPATIMDKVVEVKAMKKLKNGSLREPRFKSIRFDKAIDEID